jgi:hypothetical protein
MMQTTQQKDREQSQLFALCSLRMRLVAFALLVASFSTNLLAQTPAQRYLAAEKQWLSHRPDGMTWDDDSPEAASAIDAMWNAIIDAANDYIVAHPTATSHQIESTLVAIKPVADPRTDLPLNVSVLKLKPELFAISFSDYTASIVFVLRPQQGKPQVWRIDNATPQTSDPDGLLRAWKSARAGDACRDKEPKGTYGTCGPLSARIGALPIEASGQPRFYIDASYSKDMGALFLNQTSIWRWDGESAQLLWIKAYNLSAGDEEDSSLSYRNGEFSILEKRFQRTFVSCNSCFEPTKLQTLRITPDSIEDLGESSRTPELDIIDELFWRIAHNQPTSSIATSQAVATLRQPILDAKASWEKIDPKTFYIGMLGDWSVIPTQNGSKVCFTADDIGRLNFTLHGDPHGHTLISDITRADSDKAPCPVKGAIRAADMKRK